jgi:hypothetical protein
MENLAPSVEREVSKAIQETAAAAYATIVAKANAKLHSTRSQYLQGLTFEDLGDNQFLISLEGKWAEALEDGYPSFDMSKGLLNAKNVKTAKDGHKYTHIPMERKIEAPAGAANMVDAIKAMSATNAAGRKQSMADLFTNAQGNPIVGKVATSKSENPMLNNLVKYQSRDADTGNIRSIYINYRTISENGKPWINKGFSGIKAFDDAEAEIISKIDQIIKDLM